MQTPLQKLKVIIMKSGQLTNKLDDFIDELIIEEKQGIVDAWESGYINCKHPTVNLITGEIYYNKTYKYE